MAEMRETFQRAPLRALNRYLERRGTTARQRDAFTPEALMERASRETGLDDFGDDHFLEPFRLQCEDTRANGDVHSIGWLFTSDLFNVRLRNRLFLAQHHKEDPEMFEQPIHRPLVVLGLPRTGTTRLMRILARDSAHRPLRTWEGFAPSPPPVEGRTRFDKRRWRCFAVVKAHDILSPSFQTIHAFAPDLPEECVVLFANSFDSWLTVLAADLPSYQKWFLETTHERTYMEHKKQLQLLQWKCKRDRWLLKSPGHMFGPSELMATYPDALIVQTHRDPKKVLPSIASLSAAMRTVTVSRLDDFRIGEQILEQMEVGIHRLQDHVPRIPQDQFIDIQYQDIVADPMGTVKRIYEKFDLPLSRKTETAFQEEIEANPKDKKGKHHYTAEQFGLSPELIDEKFGAYMAENQIPTE